MRGRPVRSFHAALDRRAPAASSDGRAGTAAPPPSEHRPPRAAGTRSFRPPLPGSDPNGDARSVLALGFEAARDLPKCSGGSLWVSKVARLVEHDLLVLNRRVRRPL